MDADWICRLEFIDKDGVVQLKGRMACELTSADEILMTESLSYLRGFVEGDFLPFYHGKSALKPAFGEYRSFFHVYICCCR